MKKSQTLEQTRQIILRHCPADLHNWLRHEAVDRGLTMEKLIIELLQKGKGEK